MSMYFAVLMPTKEGRYFIQFPDIPEGFTQGEDLEDALEMAADVLAICAEEYAKERKPLPEPSNIVQVKAWAETQRDDPDLAQGEFLYQLFRTPNVDMTPVRINVSLAKSVLDAVDEKARIAGMTRSGFLARAAQAYQVTE